MSDVDLAIRAAKQDSDLKLRNAALVYLYHDHDMMPSKLAQICNLARTTIASYVRKFADLLDWAREKFHEKVQQVKKAVRKITEEKFYVYIDQIFMPNGEIWCKIGQTTKTPEKRAANFKWEGNIRPSHVNIMHVIECKSAAAMNCLEDCLRIAMVALDPSKFCKQDRLLCWEDDYPERILNNPYVQMGIKEFAI